LIVARRSPRRCIIYTTVADIIIIHVASLRPSAAGAAQKTMMLKRAFLTEPHNLLHNAILHVVPPDVLPQVALDRTG